MRPHPGAAIVLAAALAGAAHALPPAPGLFGEHVAAATGQNGDSADGRSIDVPEGVAVDVSYSSGDVSGQAVATASASPGEVPHADVQGHVSGNAGGRAEASVDISYSLVVERTSATADIAVPIVVTLRGDAQADPGAYAIAQVRSMFIDSRYTTASVDYRGGSAGFNRVVRTRVGANLPYEIRLLAQGEARASASGAVEFQAVADPVVGVDPCFPAKDRYQVRLSDNLFPDGRPRCRIEPAGIVRVRPGTPVAFDVVCTDAGDGLSLSSDGLPAGASMTPPLPLRATGQVASHFTWTPPAVGRTSLFFTARDDGGEEGQAFMMVEVTDGPLNHPPVADAGPDRVVPSTGEQTLVSFDSSRSTDPDGDKLGFEWVDPDGHVVAFGDFRDQVVEGTLPVGRHELTLIVTDTASETACDTVVVEVGDGVSPTTSTSTSTSTTVVPAPGASTSTSTPAASVPTTTIPLPGAVVIEAVGTGATAARVVCSVPDPAPKGAACEVEGLAAGEMTPHATGEVASSGARVARTVRRRLDRQGRAVVALRLNALGKRLLKQRGVLAMLARVTLADGRGRQGTVEQLVTVLRRGR